jgi:hypothetical protein
MPPVIVEAGGRASAGTAGQGGSALIVGGTVNAFAGTSGSDGLAGTTASAAGTSADSGSGN